ncbi:MAG: phage tail length tape measure family protein [Actinomycetota bacterium]
MPSRTVVLKITGDASSLKKAFGQASNDAQGFGTKLGEVSSKIAGAGKKLSLGLTLPIAAFAGVSVKSFAESQDALAKLQNTLNNSPKLAGETTAAFEDLANALQKKTKADDESVIAGASVLGQFDLTGKQIRGLLPLVVDYAQKTGQDVPSAAQAIGKAFMGNAKALKNIGINFKATGDRGQDFATITDLLRDKVGGFAEQEGKGAAGQAEILKNKFDELQENIGAKLLPILQRVIDFASGLIDKFTSLSPAIQNFILIGAGILAALGPALVAMKNLKTLIQGVGMAFQFLAAANPEVLLLIAAIVAAGVVIFVFRDKIWNALKAVGGFFVQVFGSIVGFFKSWGPLILSVLLGPLGALLTNFGGFRDKVLKVFGAVRDGIVSAFSRAKDLVVGIWTGIVDVVKGTINVLLSVIERGINLALLPARKLSTAPIIGRAIPDLPEIKIPRLAAGGIVTRPTLALIGEAGPEAVVPLSRKSEVATTVNVTLDLRGAVIADRNAMDSLARTIRDHLLQLKRRTGTLGLA